VAAVAAGVVSITSHGSDGPVYAAGVDVANVGDPVRVDAPPATTPADPKKGEQWTSSVVTDAKPEDVSKLTTPTRKVTRKPDGTYVMTLSAAPVRAKDDQGRWHPLDGTLVKRSGRYEPRLSSTDVSIAARTPDQGSGSHGKAIAMRAPTQQADGESLVVLNAGAGTFGLSHPSLSGVEGAVDSNQRVVYTDAFADGRDLVEAPARQGVEESVVLPNASASRSYDVVVQLPDDLTAIESPSGVLFVDPDHHHRIGGGYGSAVAFDAGGGPRLGPVSVSIVEQSGHSVRIRVSVDDAWLHAPERVFPVTIDPFFSGYTRTSADNFSYGDTYTVSTMPDWGFWSDGYIQTGSVNFGGFVTTESYLRFDVSSLQDGHSAVNLAVLGLRQVSSGTQCESPIEARLMTSWIGPYTSWNSAPAAYESPVGSAPTPCGATPSYMGVTELVRTWLSGEVPNNGLQLTARYPDVLFPQSLRTFASGDTALDADVPFLQMSYTKVDYSVPANVGRVEGQRSQVPITITNTASDATWPAKSTMKVGYKLQNVTTGAVYLGSLRTALPEAVAPGHAISMDVDLEGLANDSPAGWNIRFGLIDESSTPEYSYYDSGAYSSVMHVQVVSSVGHARGDAAYSTFAGGVNTTTGALEYDATDAQVASAGPNLDVSRTYSSNDTWDGGFGRGWSSSLDMYVFTVDDQPDLVVHYPDGRLEEYVKKANGTYAPPYGYYGSLTVDGNGNTRLLDRDETVYLFNSNGRLSQVTDRNGLVLSYDYTGSQVTTITNQTSGRSLHLTWWGAPRYSVKSIETDPVSLGNGTAAPLRWTYNYSVDYDAQTLRNVVRLTEACDPIDPNHPELPAPCEHYDYQVATPWNMTKITRPLGNTAAEVTYGADGKVASRKDGANDVWQFIYATSGSGASALGITEVIDPRGKATYDVHNTGGQVVTRYDADLHVHSYIYDAKQGFLVSETDENNNTTAYTYEPEDLVSHGNPRTVTDGNHKTTYNTWDPMKPERLLETRDGRSADVNDTTYKTALSYDAAGNRTAVDPPGDLAPTVWVYANGQSGAQGQGCDVSGDAVDGGTVPKGMLLCEQKPGQDPIRYSYNSHGDLMRRVDPGGLATEFTYDALGRVRSAHAFKADDPTNVDYGATDTDYDARGQVVSVTEPAASNLISGDSHRQRTLTTYDENGNPVKVTLRDVGGSAHADPDRVTTYEYDLADRENHVVYPSGGGEMRREFDPDSNVTAVIDPSLRRTETSYTNTNQPLALVLKSYVADPIGAPGTTSDLTLQHFEYDPGGRKTAAYDALERKTTFAYDGEDRVTDTVLQTGGPTTLEHVEYDAVGNKTVVRTGDVGGASRTVTTTYTPASLPTVATLDAAGLNRVTTTTYDTAGRPATRTIRHGADPIAAETDMDYYGPSGLLQHERVKTGTGDLTTTHVYDARGLESATTDPNGNTMSFFFDAVGRPTKTVLPAVPLDGAGTLSPTTTTGYDTFTSGPTHTQDANGNVIRTEYDKLGRRTKITHPTYTPPSGGPAIIPTETYGYDNVGNLTTTTDRRNATTTFAFDTLNRVYRQTDPSVDGAPAGTVLTSYDAVGNVTKRIDQTGRATASSYDSRNRVATQTIASGTGEAATTTFGYDSLNNQVLVHPQSGRDTHREYDTAGALTKETTALGHSTRRTYDAAGRVRDVIDPLGQSDHYDYDLAGRKLQEQHRDANGIPVATTSHTYDGVGNEKSIADPDGHQTFYDYDADNRIVGVTQPVDTNAAHTITTSYGYDANANLARVTDGNSNSTTVTYNPWNQPQARTEPGTPGQTAPGDRTWTTSYDGGGLPVTEAQPGGVTITRTYDPLGRLRTEAGSATADAPAASRTFSYDTAGRLKTASHPSATIALDYHPTGLLWHTTGGAGNATFAYDTDANLTARDDPAGHATFTYDNDNNLATETDPLTHTTRTNTWDNARQLTNVAYGTGPTAPSRVLTFDANGQPLTDTLSVATQVRAQSTYGYDPAGNLTAKSIGPAGVAGAGNNAYTYDGADQLTSWTNPLGVVTNYAYDKAGNRTAAGLNAFTFDARNRLTSATRLPSPPRRTISTTTSTAAAPTTTTSPTGTTTTTRASTTTTTHPPATTSTTSGLPGVTLPPITLPPTTLPAATTTTSPAGTTTSSSSTTTTTTAPPAVATTNYSWTSRGTLAHATIAGVGTTNYTYDSLGRLSQVTNPAATIDDATATAGLPAIGTVNYTYDALDRIATSNTAPFTYAGRELDPTTDNSSTYSRSPSGDLLALTTTSATDLNPTPQSRLALRDRHGDLTGLLTPAGDLTDTYAYDPYGDPTEHAGPATGDLTPNVGFQSDYTDPATTQVWMGARWYDPDNDTFLSQDTNTGQLRTPFTLNQYTYAQDNPLNYYDPDGHFNFRLGRLFSSIRAASAWIVASARRNHVGVKPSRAALRALARAVHGPGAKAVRTVSARLLGDGGPPIPAGSAAIPAGGSRDQRCQGGYGTEGGDCGPRMGTVYVQWGPTGTSWSFRLNKRAKEHLRSDLGDTLYYTNEIRIDGGKPIGGAQKDQPYPDKKDKAQGVTVQRVLRAINTVHDTRKDAIPPPSIAGETHAIHIRQKICTRRNGGGECVWSDARIDYGGS
jgi:RHS repeat-associated protein